MRAPELRGAGWINTDRPLTLEELRGRVVLLDFWTFCCVNCLHVIEELRSLEERFGDQLVVIGVHSPKFPHEQDHQAVVRAVQRHRIHHPVLDDPAMETWQQYAVRAWPTLVLIDRRGDAVAVAEGEGKTEAIAELVQQLLDEAGEALATGPAFRAPALEAASMLLFPGKVASDGDGRLAIADTGHDRVVLCELDGRVLNTFDGFDQPQGVRFDGDRLLVCDTVNDRLVAVDLATGAHTELADGLSSAWDVVRLDTERLVVAEAGRHRLMSVPSGGGAPVVFAGTRAEGLLDGPATSAMLAQPSGLSVLPDGAVVFADSEISALRVVRDGVVDTLVGEGLFDWGSDDGDQHSARLQHPLGVVALADGSVAVADTFNSALRLWKDGQLTTVPLWAAATDAPVLAEPGGLDVLPDGRLVVADTAHHRVVLVDMAAGKVEALPLDDRRGDPLCGIAGAPLTLTLTLDTGGEALDPSQGPPVRVTVSPDPPTLLGPGPRAWALATLPTDVELTLGSSGEGTLAVGITAATCTGNVCSVHRRSSDHMLRVRDRDDAVEPGSRRS